MNKQDNHHKIVKQLQKQWDTYGHPPMSTKQSHHCINWQNKKDNRTP